jgi:hypothetical protein
VKQDNPLECADSILNGTWTCQDCSIPSTLDFSDACLAKHTLDYAGPCVTSFTYTDVKELSGNFTTNIVSNECEVVINNPVSYSIQDGILYLNSTTWYRN